MMRVIGWGHGGSVGRQIAQSIASKASDGIDTVFVTFVGGGW